MDYSGYPTNMEYGDATEIMWDENAEDMLNDASDNFLDQGFPAAIVAPTQSFPQEFQTAEQVDASFEDMLDMSMCDFDGVDEGDMMAGFYDDDIQIKTAIPNDNLSVVTPTTEESQERRRFFATVSPDVSFRESKAEKIPGSDELTTQYTEAIMRFAASMRRSEETRSEILRQKLVVPDIKTFNAGVDSRNQLWSAMDDSTRSVHSQ